ncbi:MAG: hypothetical protein GKR94_03860 [Gammaproteobacteria bacterium]|nr:hypothetical protein [Gammaproteobacteria bacterium]
MSALYTHLQLGRVSNLPTVWSNVAAGAALAGALIPDLRLLAVLVAMTLFYEAGMYLNDAFDREIDAIERPERPIPSGRISATAVFCTGFALMALAVACLWAAGVLAPGGTGWLGPLSALALAAAIVLYDAWHKNNPLSPFLMGICRMLVYVVAALVMVESLPAKVLEGAAVLLAYLIGLTYVAKQENLVSFKGGWPLLFLACPIVYFPFLAWATPSGIVIYIGLVLWIGYALTILLRPTPGHVPKAVISLIAGISLIDALFVVVGGHPVMAWGCVSAFAATLLLQRLVSGT